MCYDMSSGWFNPAKPPRTCSNHSTGQGTRPVVELHMSSRWFNPTDPAQTIAQDKEQDLWGSLT